MIAFMHPTVGEGRITVAIRLPSVPTPHADFEAVECALAFCSPKDRFERKRGRLIALGRLEKGRSYAVHIAPGEKLIKKRVLEALTRILTAEGEALADLPVASKNLHNGAPSWARSAAEPA